MNNNQFNQPNNENNNTSFNGQPLNNQNNNMIYPNNNNLYVNSNQINTNNYQTTNTMSQESINSQNNYNSQNDNTKKKKNILLIVTIVLIVIIAIVTTLMLVLGNKQDEQDNGYQSDISEGNKTNNESKEETKELVDFWINEYKFPNTTKDFSLNLFDNVAGVPVDLTKLENGKYTFNYTIFNYDIVEPGEYSVKKTSEIKGKRFSSSAKDITVKTESGDALFTIVLEDNSDNEEITFYDSIKNNWWNIPLEADRIFGKDVENVHKYDGDIIIEKAIENMGRPTHIYAWVGATNLQLDEEGVGSVTYDIVYDYNQFKIVLSVSEIVNNTTVGRWVDVIGFTYYTNQSFEARIKDIQRNYTITDVLPML